MVRFATASDWLNKDPENSETDKMRATVLECEDLLRAGQIPAAAQKLSALNTADVPRELKLPFANLCRRAGLVSQGLRLLMPVTRETAAGPPTAKPPELAEYAVLLQRCGAISEAYTILIALDRTAVPDAPLFTAYCLFAQWRYAEAVPHLKEFLVHVGDPYKKLVGQVNLSAAYLAMGDFPAAVQVLGETLVAAQSGGHSRLAGNCYELLAQASLQAGLYDRADEELRSSAAAFGGGPSSDGLFVRKWQAVLKAYRTGDVAELETFREVARERGHFESVREADLHRLKAAFDEKRFHHLYFGTPLTAYREHIFKVLGRRPTADTYVWGGKESVLDLAAGNFNGHEIDIAGGKIHQVLHALAQDFYRPVRVGTLFQSLFPGEHFNIFSSPGRIHQLLHRARLWCKENHISAKITGDKSDFRLEPLADFGIRVALEMRPVEKHSARLKLLKERLGRAPFSNERARETLGITRSEFRRFTDWALNEGHLIRQGAGRAIKYKIAA